MNARVCSALNPEVFPKYRRSLETASTQAETAPASSGVLARIVIIVVAATSACSQCPAQARRAKGEWSRPERSTGVALRLPRYAAPRADSPRPAFRNNNADPAKSMAKNAFPPNPRNSGNVQEVT